MLVAVLGRPEGRPYYGRELVSVHGYGENWISLFRFGFYVASILRIFPE